ELLGEPVATRHETGCEGIRFLHFALGALAAALELSLLLSGAARGDLGALACRRGLEHRLLGLLYGDAQRVRRSHRFLARAFGRQQLGAQSKQLCAPTERARAGRYSREPDGATRVREGRAVFDGAGVSEQCAHPAPRGTRRIDAMRESFAIEILGLL